MEYQEKEILFCSDAESSNAGPHKYRTNATYMTNLIRIAYVYLKPPKSINAKSNSYLLSQLQKDLAISSLRLFITALKIIIVSIKGRKVSASLQCSYLTVKIFHRSISDQVNHQ